MPRLECPTETDKAYIAGVIDSDGSICLPLCKPKYLCPKINITNRNLEMLVWTRRVFGVGWHSDKPKIPKQRQVYQIEIAGRKSCLILLKLLLPYLKIKEKQAKLVIEFCENHKYKKYSERDWEIFRMMKELNRRGELQ